MQGMPQISAVPKSLLLIAIDSRQLTNSMSPFASGGRLSEYELRSRQSTSQLSSPTAVPLNNISDAYSIDIRFYFDDVSASFNGYQRILDFKNRTSDSGLYDRSGSLQLFATGGSDDPHAGTTGHVFSNGMLAELLVTRNASSFFSALVIGQGDFSVTDMNGATRFSGPDNIIYFFMHDFVSLTNFPDRPEAGTGFIDRIQVTTFPAEVPASPGVDFLASSSWRALAFSAGGDGGRN
jgi:hypothetical protein